MNLASSHSSSSFSSLFASLKFGIKKSTKNDFTEDTTSVSSPTTKARRQAVSLDFSATEHSQILEELLEFQQLENDKKQRHGLLNRRKPSIPKRTSVYNNDESLHNAVMVGNVELTRQVLQNEKVDINAFLPPGWTALHHACRQGNIKMIKLLLDFDADTTLLNDEGMTPLVISVTNGNFDAAACLIHDGGVSCEEIRNGFQSALPYSKHKKLRGSRSFDGC